MLGRKLKHITCKSTMGLFILSLFTVFAERVAASSGGVDPFSEEDFATVSPRGDDLHFSMQKTEVTQAQYYSVTRTTPAVFSTREYCPSDYKEEGGGMCPNFPVERVSYDDIYYFLEDINSLSADFHYRLPNLWEWKVAADGNKDPGAWCRANSGGQTHAVGSVARPKEHNRFGLYVMTGNVWEWTAADPGDHATYIEGGSWDSDEGNCHAGAAQLDTLNPGHYEPIEGFRLIRERK